MEEGMNGTSPRRHKVLLVEDSMVEAELLRRTLVGGGYQVRVAYDGREGYAAACADAPDLIVSDIRMPQLNGYELCRAVKTNPALAHVPIILLSVLSEPDDIIQAVNSGADGYSIKPYTAASLLGRVQSLLAKPSSGGNGVREPMEIEYQGCVHRIESTPQQVLNLLLSVYENTLMQNRELRATQTQLSLLNELLEEKVRERTAELEESEARYRAAFEQAAVGIAHVGIEGRWMRLNQRLCDIVGGCYSRMLERSLLEFTHPAEVADTVAAMRRILEGQAENDLSQKRFILDSGENIWVYQTLALVRRPDGSPDYFIVVIEDINEQKAAEAAVRQLNAELEHRVEERTAELKAANTELESFVYAVSHDLRAPLRAMNGLSAILAQKFDAQLGDEGKTLIQHIRQGAQHMGELIEGLLLLSRSTRGEIAMDPIDLSALAETVLARLAQTDRSRRVEWQVQPGLATRGDRRMLEALMTNLLTNAWKYTAGRDPGRIRFFAAEHDGEAWLCIEDNGTGFDMQYADRLFQPFQRLHRQDQFPGLGIGLATVKRIVERHGGSIRAEGRPDQGARFYFRFWNEAPRDDGAGLEAGESRPAGTD